MTQQRLTLAFATIVATVFAGCYVDASQDQCGHGDIGDFCLESSDCGEGLLCGDDSFCAQDPEAGGGGSGAGDASSSGNGSGGSGGSGSGGSEPTSCADHSECNNGFFCDEGLCQPGSIPCDDLAGESACAARTDCEPMYAGVNCSCGPNCQCQPGEPGCVCESFEYFACTDAP